jgi:hypothetical protein
MPGHMITSNAFTRSTRHSSFVAAFDHGQGVLRMAPHWVPRSFCVPGRRIKLHPDDYFALGGERGGIDERWFSSTIRADNGPLTGADEGLSFAVGLGGERLPFDEVIADLGASLIGERLWREYGGWPVYSKAPPKAPKRIGSSTAPRVSVQKSSPFSPGSGSW